MSYTPKRITPFLVDIIQVDPNNGQRQDMQGTFQNTNAYLAGSPKRLRLPSGSHYHITWSAGQLVASGDDNFINGAIWQGENAGGGWTGVFACCSTLDSLTRGRSVASVLILNSEITGSYIDLRFYYDEYQGTHSGNWALNSSAHYSKLPIIITELPA